MKYKVIKTEKQYEAYCGILEELVSSEKNADKQEDIELLTLLIEDWDERNRLSPKLDPVQILQTLMDEHHINQSELANIAGVGKSYTSEILSYKKRMSKKVIRNIANYFKIRQEALNKPYALKNQTKTHMF
jgi:HTH-type transcriptional regulator / antitoxin HigA